MKWDVSGIFYFPYHVATIIISPYFTNTDTEWDEQWNDIISNGDS